LAFAGDSTWRWPMLGFGDAHRRFWRQCVLWLAKKDEQTEGRVWIRLAGRRVMRGTRVEFAMGAEDAQGETVEAAQFDVAVSTPEGRAVEVRPTKSGDETSGPPCSAKPRNLAITKSPSPQRPELKRWARPSLASWYPIRTWNSTALPPSRA
jgi:hypothetical protein